MPRRSRPNSGSGARVGGRTGGTSLPTPKKPPSTRRQPAIPVLGTRSSPSCPGWPPADAALRGQRGQTGQRGQSPDSPSNDLTTPSRCAGRTVADLVFLPPTGPPAAPGGQEGPTILSGAPGGVAQLEERYVRNVEGEG